MLEAIRKRSAGIVIKGLLALLILSFAMWGIADVFSPGGANTSVAKVGDIEVPPDPVRRDFQREVERLSNLFGSRIDTEQARSLGVAESVLNRIIERTLFDLAAGDLGAIVSDDLVRQNIRRIPGFKNAQGEFDRLRYQQTLQNNRLTEAGFIAQTRGDIARSQYLSMIGTSPAAPKRMSEILFAYQNEKRVAQVLTIPYSSVSVSNQPDDAQLAEFHSKNAARFTAPETRKLTFVNLTADDLAKEIAISDEEIASAYEARRDEFVTPESRVLKQLRLRDEESAKKAYAMLQGGADFAAVAKEIADIDPDRLDLGAMTRAQLLPELAEPVFSLQPGNFTAPLKSVLGWHILGLVKINSEIQQSLDDAKEGLVKEMAAEKAIDSLYQVANNLEDQLGGGATLEEAARALNLPLQTIPVIDRIGNDALAARVTGLPKGEFLSIAFDTPEGQDSPLSEAGNDGYFIVRVDAVTLPALRPLDSVREEVVNAWSEEQQALEAKKEADDLVSKVKSGRPLNELANDLGLTISTSIPFTRNQSVKDIPPGLVATLFTSDIGDVAAATGNRAHVIARLDKIIAANPVAEKDKLVALRQQLSAAMRSDLVGQLASGLRQEYPVTINPASLNALF